MFDIDYLMSIVNNKRKLDIKKLFSSKTKLFVGLHNLKRDSIEYPEIHNFSTDGYSQILKAAMSPAYFRPGAVKINDIRYKDLPYRNSTHKNHFQQAAKNGATDILVIFNYHRQQGKVFSGEVPENVFCIAPKAEWHLSRFETRPQKLRQQYELMKNYTRSIFLL